MNEFTENPKIVAPDICTVRNQNVALSFLIINYISGFGQTNRMH